MYDLKLGPGLQHVAARLINTERTFSCCRTGFRRYRDFSRHDVTKPMQNEVEEPLERGEDPLSLI